MGSITYETPGQFTWQWPAGETAALVELWGGGGGGNAGTASRGGGGGAGGSYARTLVSKLAGSALVVVGSGGAGGQTGFGTNGADSSFQQAGFSLECRAPGGTRGFPAQHNGGTAGANPLGQVTYRGGDGGSASGQVDGGGGGGAAAGRYGPGNFGATDTAGGEGGLGPQHGIGDGGFGGRNGEPGQPGHAPGGGGGGGGFAAAGGGGANGRAVITCPPPRPGTRNSTGCCCTVDCDGLRAWSVDDVLTPHWTRYPRTAIISFGGFHWVGLVPPNAPPELGPPPDCGCCGAANASWVATLVSSAQLIDGRSSWAWTSDQPSGPFPPHYAVATAGTALATVHVPSYCAHAILTPNEPPWNCVGFYSLWAACGFRIGPGQPPEFTAALHIVFTPPGGSQHVYVSQFDFAFPAVPVRRWSSDCVAVGSQIPVFEFPTAMTSLPIDAQTAAESGFMFPDFADGSYGYCSAEGATCTLEFLDWVLLPLAGNDIQTHPWP